MDISRREFLQGAALGTVSIAAAGLLGTGVLAAEKEAEGAAENTVLGFAGKAKFAGVGSVRPVMDDVLYVGVSERRTELFENVYPIPRGVSYNSYVLLDEKTVLFDTVDRSVAGQFFENLSAVLGDRSLDYLVVNHMEPDHSSAITEVLVRYPQAQVVCTAAAAEIMKQFFAFDVTERAILVKEGDTLKTGIHTLTFVMAPMVHWPEVMVTYDDVHGILFSADAFGSFGALNGNLFADEVNFETEWIADARRYYTNIVGKYGPQVQDVLKKAGTVDIRMLCPTHGPVWRENLGWILDKYDKWSSYTPEEDAVMVVYGSVYGGTESAANALAACLSANGVRNVSVYDVSKTHVSELIAEAFRCSHIVLASITYNMGIFTPMKNFLMDLAAHNMQNRTVSLIENGSWSPASGNLMKEILDGMKSITYAGDLLSFKSSPGDAEYEAIAALANVIADTFGAEEAAPAAEAAPAEKYVCSICGYVYEEEGELPADFKCPICGQGADKFELRAVE